MTFYFLFMNCLESTKGTIYVRLQRGQSAQQNNWYSQTEYWHNKRTGYQVKIFIPKILLLSSLPQWTYNFVGTSSKWIE